MDICRQRKWGDPVRVKASFNCHSKKLDGQIVPEYRRFSLDPQLTTFEILHSLISRAFDIQSEFLIQYRIEDSTGQEVFLQLLSDWDLEAAFDRAADPCLCLRIDPVPIEQTVDEWDLVNLPSSDHKVVQSIKEVIKVDPTLQTKILTKVEKTISLMQQALNFTTGNGDEFSAGISTTPLTDAEFTDYRDGVGTLIKIERCRQRIFQGGLEPSLRRVLWKHLLNVYPDGLNGSERMRYMSKKTDEYQRLKNQWMFHYTNKKMSEELIAVTGMVKKDVLRTDRQHPYYAGGDDNPNVEQLFNILTTYSIYHPSTGYCQGMSDMASPILYVMGNEAHAYIAFTALMERLKENFTTTGAIMTLKFEHLASALSYHDPVFFSYLQRHHAIDLLFCYRWLLLEMKREFAFDDALRMLEVTWSSLPSKPRQEELALFEHIPEMSAVSQPIPLPRVKESAYTKVCAMRRQSSSSPAASQESWKNCRKDLSLTSSDDEDVVDEAFVEPELTNGPIPSNSPPEFKIEAEETSESSSEDEQVSEKEPLLEVVDTSLQDFEVIGSCEEVTESSSTVSSSSTATQTSKSTVMIRPSLPPPDVLGCGNPFLIFLCLTLLLQHRDFIMSRSLDSTSLAMHFDRLVRKHNVERVLSQARTLYYRYLSHFNVNSQQQPMNRSRPASPRRNLGV